MGYWNIAMARAEEKRTAELNAEVREKEGGVV